MAPKIVYQILYVQADFSTKTIFTQNDFKDFSQPFHPSSLNKRMATTLLFLSSINMGYE